MLRSVAHQRLAKVVCSAGELTKKARCGEKSTINILWSYVCIFDYYHLEPFGFSKVFRTPQSTWVRTTLHLAGDLPQKHARVRWRRAAPWHAFWRVGRRRAVLENFVILSMLDGAIFLFSTVEGKETNFQCSIWELRCFSPKIGGFMVGRTMKSKIIACCIYFVWWPYSWTIPCGTSKARQQDDPRITLWKRHFHPAEQVRFVKDVVSLR